MYRLWVSFHIVKPFEFFLFEFVDELIEFSELLIE